eukprot:1321373-Alexandrium_andersonii.AAC.1
MRRGKYNALRCLTCARVQEDPCCSQNSPRARLRTTLFSPPGPPANSSEPSGPPSPGFPGLPWPA